MLFSECTEVQSVALISNGICLMYVRNGEVYDLHVDALRAETCPSCGTAVPSQRKTIVPGVCTLDYLRRQYGAHRLHWWDSEMKNFALEN